MNNAPPPPPRRRIIQIVGFECDGGSTSIIALCDDGSLWRNTHLGITATWLRVDVSGIVGAP